MKALKGSEREGMAEFDIKGYDVAITLSYD